MRRVRVFFHSTRTRPHTTCFFFSDIISNKLVKLPRNLRQTMSCHLNKEDFFPLISSSGILHDAGTCKTPNCQYGSIGAHPAVGTQGKFRYSSQFGKQYIYILVV
jgi:hypothetical protein